MLSFSRTLAPPRRGGAALDSASSLCPVSRSGASMPACAAAHTQPSLRLGRVASTPRKGNMLRHFNNHEGATNLAIYFAVRKNYPITAQHHQLVSTQDSYTVQHAARAHSKHEHLSCVILMRERTYPSQHIRKFRQMSARIYGEREHESFRKTLRERAVNRSTRRNFQCKKDMSASAESYTPSSKINKKGMTRECHSLCTVTGAAALALLKYPEAFEPLAQLSHLFVLLRQLRVTFGKQLL